MIRTIVKLKAKSKCITSRYIHTQPPQPWLGTLIALSNAEDAQAAADRANEKNRSLEQRVTQLEADMKLLQLHVEQTTKTTVPRSPPLPAEPEDEPETCCIL